MAQPVFVVGAERSGTTLLRLMLNEHPELLLPPETWFLTDLMNGLPNSGSLTAVQIERATAICIGHARWHDIGVSESELRVAVERRAAPTLGEFVDAIFGVLLARNGKRRWGDKTPGYVLEIDRIRDLFADAQFIHVIRDARAVSLSLADKRWFGPHLRDAAGRWSHCVRAGISAGRALPGPLYTEVRFEDLVTHPRRELSRVCEFLGLRYSPVMLEYFRHAAPNIAPWQRQHHGKTQEPPRPEEAEAWRDRMTPYRLLVIEAIAGKEMLAVGQELAVTGWRRALVWAIRAMENAFSWALATRRRLVGLRPRASLR